MVPTHACPLGLAKCDTSRLQQWRPFIFAIMWTSAVAPATAVTTDFARAEQLKRLADDAMAHGRLTVGAEKYYERSLLLRALDLSADTPAGHPLMTSQDEGFLRAGRLKLRHDAEQLEYLVQEGKLQARPWSGIAKLYINMIGQLPIHLHSVDLQPFNKYFNRAFNRAVHMTAPSRLKSKLVRKSFDAADVQRRFRESELPPEETGCESQNGAVFADGLLTPKALQALYNWCLESTMWFGIRAGYMAAFLQEGFNSPLMVQLVEELRAVFPDILGDHQLMNMWAFKYANNASDYPLNGTQVHADVAAVNVNFWITPDDANEDAEGGGLVVYTKHAPKDWGFADYNGLDAVPRIREYLQDSGKIVVPHRRNRVVIFNSNLFHETQIPYFKAGYKNRRINLTLLFGRRCGGAANERADSSFPKAHAEEL